jgi:hypothetical protein
MYKLLEVVKSEWQEIAGVWSFPHKVLAVSANLQELQAEHAKLTLAENFPMVGGWHKYSVCGA